MFGMLLTNTAASGACRWTVSSVLWNWVWNVAVGVIVAAELVQTSLAPSRIVTYWTSAVSLPAWVGPSTIFAPVTARFAAWPLMAGRGGSSRPQWLIERSGRDP